MGVSGCGKTRFSNKLAHQASRNGYSVKHVSTDKIRRELLGDFPRPKSDQMMMAVSKQAFDMVDALVCNYASYPVSTNIIIVDSTGLDREFRQKMAGFAKGYGYSIDLVVFDISSEELFQNIETGTDVTNISVGEKHQKSLLREIATIDKKHYNKIVTYKTLAEYANVEFSFSALSNPIVAANTVAVIGDVHECVDELKQLIAKIPKEATLVFVGDLFDKNTNTYEMLDYMEELKKTFSYTIVMGNHERYIGRRLRGIIQPNINIEEKFMTAVAPLLTSPAYKEKFLALYDTMVPYVEIDRLVGKHIVVTHAPVHTWYIGKESNDAVAAQANLRFISRDEQEMLNELEFISVEASKSHPFHVFGHVAHDSNKPVVDKNKIWLDTGCVHGGYLSAVIFKDTSYSFVTVKSKKEVSEKLIKIKKEI